MWKMHQEIMLFNWFEHVNLKSIYWCVNQKCCHVHREENQHYCHQREKKNWERKDQVESDLLKAFVLMVHHYFRWAYTKPNRHISKVFINYNGEEVSKHFIHRFSIHLVWKECLKAKFDWRKKNTLIRFSVQ